ncbi:uncharacterized protein LOC130429758 isoform X2 [Triplophysa dalaica]|uniref:uncharacterized protein LOC130429758 isoform X2 n=1 Tax=Triplophysa dalaica TaxID=1582913 RepID=UPI0024DFF979|nr:uncharacterized protein LOC130429758 isoform X2 [Triplophysa dalaica]
MKDDLYGDEVKSMSVMEGDSVTLHMDDTDIQTDDMILWSFVTQASIIVRINREANTVSVYDDVHDGMFRDRLRVDVQTGSLTITNITTRHSGLYQMTISGMMLTFNRFIVTVYARLPVPDITSYCPQNSASVSKCVLLCSVMNVSHVSLSWYKGKSLLSSISVSDLNIRLSLPLEVEYQDTNTYSCVINNPITKQTTHLDINQLRHRCSARLPVPVISRDSSQCSSSNCSVFCSVMNVSGVSLSWYKGKSLLSSVSVSDLNIRLSLPLEVEYQDTNTYRCVINNPITNHTQHLNINELCQPCSDCVCCCYGPETLIRLVISAVVGVATVAVLVYDIRSTRVPATPSPCQL